MHNYLESNKTLNILILGGGPIGLFAGYKMLKKGHNVTIFEKRKNHTRHNILSLGQDMNENSMTLDTLNLVPSEIVNELNTVSSFARINHDILEQNNNESAEKPYLMPSSKTYYIVLSELEVVYEKHFKNRGGILLKPEDMNSFQDISVTNNVITYTDNSGSRHINLEDYDIILVNDGARSYYRDIYFRETSYTEHIVNNIHYYGLTDKSACERRTVQRVHQIDDNLRPLAYGLILIHDILDKQSFFEKFKIVDKIQKKCDPEYIYQLSDDNGVIMNEIINDESRSDINPIGAQNLSRMFVCENYLYISIMVNPDDLDLAKDYKTIQSRSGNIKYDDLSENIQTYLMFTLYYYDLTELIDPRTNNNNISLFPLIFSSVDQSCTFIKKSEGDYRLMFLFGDAQVSGNFHTGLVLNKNMMIVNNICTKIDEYIDSHPKNDQGLLDKEFLRLLFFNCNLLNQSMKNEIVSRSIKCLVNFDEIDNEHMITSISDVPTDQYNEMIACKNCPEKKRVCNQVCNNLISFIKFISENSNKDILIRIIKYLILSGNEKYKYEYEDVPCTNHRLTL